MRLTEDVVAVVHVCLTLINKQIYIYMCAVKTFAASYNGAESCTTQFLFQQCIQVSKTQIAIKSSANRRLY